MAEVRNETQAVVKSKTTVGGLIDIRDPLYANCTRPKGML